MTEPMVEAIGVHKSYVGVEVLKGVNLDVYKRQASTCSPIRPGERSVATPNASCAALKNNSCGAKNTYGVT